MDYYFIQTLGCKANFFDSQYLENELQKKGWLPAMQEDHPGIKLCIVNSCTVTNGAEKQSQKWVQRLAKKHPNAKIVMTGCSAEVDSHSLKSLNGIHYIVGNKDKPNLVSLVLNEIQHQTQKQPQILTIARKAIDSEWPLPFHFKPSRLAVIQRTRQFLKIQEGCNSFCTFCIIPYGRGPSRSLSIQDVIERIKQHTASGTNEIVLTATNLGDYGKDWANTSQLENLCEEILLKTTLQRLRLTSLDPSEISEKLLNLMRDTSRICPHLHISLQSPHSKILRLMKRKYSFEKVKECLEKISFYSKTYFENSFFVGMDVITGFPGETEEDFEWGYDKLKALPWTRLHVFPFSERKNTPATRLKNKVPALVKSERVKRLMALSLDRVQSHYSNFVKKELKNILLESCVKGPDGNSKWRSGYTPDYLRIIFPPSGNHKPFGSENEIVSANITHTWTQPNFGEISLIADV